MPRKTSGRRLDRLGRRRRFNEAAARCRGKPTRRSRPRTTPRDASMRPRPDAAENPHPIWPLLVRSSAASMRPRPDAAENQLDRPAREGRQHASMRPRPDAAENGADGEAIRFDPVLASMRPRPDAAENNQWPGVSGFNVAASMRPRPDAAENPRSRSASSRSRSCFNEAAARCRGKHDDRLPGVGELSASMRPRPDAAENAVERELRRRLIAAASMRPRPDAAENPGQRWAPVATHDRLQ